jgi:hypothetical protein
MKGETCWHGHEKKGILKTDIYQLPEGIWYKDGNG